LKLLSNVMWVNGEAIMLDRNFQSGSIVWDGNADIIFTFKILN
jgi:hypothetical protein